MQNKESSGCSCAEEYRIGLFRKCFERINQFPKKLKESLEKIGEKQNIFSDINKGDINFNKWYAEYYYGKITEMGIFHACIGYFTKENKAINFKNALLLAFVLALKKGNKLISLSYREPDEDNSLEKIKERFSHPYFKPENRKFVELAEGEVKEIYLTGANEGGFMNCLLKPLKLNKANKNYKGRLHKYCISLDEKEVPSSFKNLIQNLRGRENISQEILNKGPNYTHWYALSFNSNINIGYFRSMKVCGSKSCTNEERFITALSLKYKKETNKWEISYDEPILFGIGIEEVRKMLNNPESNLVKTTEDEVFEICKTTCKKSFLELLL